MPCETTDLGANAGALVHVVCRQCGLAGIWTDDPRSFLETICQRRSACTAELAGRGVTATRSLGQAAARPASGSVRLRR